MEDGEGDRNTAGRRSREAKTYFPPSSASETAMVYVLGVLLPENQFARVSAPFSHSSRTTNETNGFSVRVDAFLRHRSQHRTPYMCPVPNSRPVSSQRPDPDSTDFNHRLPLLTVHCTTRSARHTRESELPPETRFHRFGRPIFLCPQTQYQWLDVEREGRK